MTIEVPYIQDKELQQRFENWLIKRGNDFSKPRTISAQSFTVVVYDAQDAFWIGANHLAIIHRLFDGPLSRTLS